MRVSLALFGREVLTVEAVAGDGEDGDDHETAAELGADTERADVADWRGQHGDADLSPVILAEHPRRSRRPRPPVVRIGTRHHRDHTPRATVTPGGFGFRSGNT
ncbi:hypothetical protein GTC6_03495 [Gordonia terrae C-6]|uniref:Uncharacterized protein n=1 Tax=Gordonia terrae C-6 TaxID=1316928 RepID=R7YDZ5_9ACTN|nr:hypothetical protein [Gordonia terrae]EON34009.1 hypothetical protein GTC6_03495 [Gordonia terrae C-6]